MRTNTLLLTAAIVAVGVGTSVAQTVYSENAVGYVNRSLGVGFTLIANPLNGTNNLISTILPTVPDGTSILKWNPVTQRFASADTYIDGLGWVDSVGTASTTVVAPGEGFFINLPSAATLTFVGEVPEGTLNVPLTSGFTLVSQPVPQQIGLSASTFPAQDGDSVLFWDPATQRYEQALSYIDGLGWVDSVGTPSEPVAEVAEGFFVNTTTARTWTRTFSVD